MEMEGNMKLAEALKLRADLNTRMSGLRSRLMANSKVQAGDVPSEDPEDLMRELDGVASQLEELIWRINTTNTRTVSPDGRTLTQLIARRDVLMAREAVIRDLVGSASSRVDRYSRNEIAIQSTVDVRMLRRELDSMSAEIRRLDNTIQELNWTTLLLRCGTGSARGGCETAAGSSGCCAPYTTGVRPGRGQA